MRRIVLLGALLAALTSPAVASAAPRLIVDGAGFGHGVGLSQYGAYGQATRGATYREILAHYYRGTELGAVSPRSTVRVLLPTSGAVTIRGATRAGRRAVSASAAYRVQTNGRAVVLRRGGRTLRLGARATVAGRGTVEIAGLGRYRGALELSVASGGGLQVVNAVALDDYLRGVVASEMPASWPLEALKAQAVVARTYAITTNKPGDGFDHYADTRSQVYRGVAGEHPRTDEAIRATRGQVVTYEGTPVPTYYFASSGGRTESVEHVWGGEPKPWLVSVPDPADGAVPNPWSRWRRTFALRDAERRLAGLVRGRLRAIRVVRRGRSPRIVTARIVGSRGRTTVSGATLQARLALPDTWARFTVRR